MVYKLILDISKIENIHLNIKRWYAMDMIFNGKRYGFSVNILNCFAMFFCLNRNNILVLSGNYCNGLDNIPFIVIDGFNFVDIFLLCHKKSSYGIFILPQELVGYVRCRFI